MRCGEHPVAFVLYALMTPSLACALDPAVLQALLNRKLPDSAVHYLVVEHDTGAVVASRWPRAEQPITPGSIVKPFTAVAYGLSTGFEFPRIVCRGGQDCWLPRGHGYVGIAEALAYSCNSYFVELGRQLSTVSLYPKTSLPLPRDGATPNTWAGLGDNWRLLPSSLLSGFRELVERRSQPGWSVVMEGLRLSAARGTARLISADAYAKTGTGPCVHGDAPGDGYTVAVFPASAPQHALLVQAHGTTGAQSAKYARVIVTAIREGR